MFKKRVKKNNQADINIAKDDLENKNNDDNDDQNMQIIKKKDKKLNQNPDLQQNGNGNNQKEIESDKYTFSKEMQGNKIDHATYDVKGNYNERQILLEKIRTQQDKGQEGEINLNEDEFDKDGVKFYKGKKAYEKQKTEEQIRQAKYLGTMGPMFQQSNVKMTSTIDYNPELCKDYKETGRCNFGDTCLYIHDRTDYKSGWEQEQDHRKKLRQKQLNGGHAEESTDEEDMEYAEKLDTLKVPVYCPICDERFKEPIMTQCKHFFCESCALQHYSKSPQCFTCGQKTNGAFQDADKEIAKIRTQKRLTQKLRNQYRKSVNKPELSESEETENSDEEENQEGQENNSQNDKKRKAQEDLENEFLNANLKVKNNNFKLQTTDWNY
ncbi:hypothetical protein PPERSA_00686 [Pseudocohnilembus persalinus]|uniref:RING-type E3 ubiquitin transferase n=1 Tax=Pseudocohnilembus persalinus TaxID=266149 RepID=A0A0V0QSR5_PSEPJ|nr:hypothetical protein PPERSA_00686 [Pseudocohnilembus persalinus]|eukprot:KRX05385.1 hypothetical protein PPERSA_00686 [Pseudocohnilembus persalinus]